MDTPLSCSSFSFSAAACSSWALAAVRTPMTVSLHFAWAEIQFLLRAAVVERKLRWKRGLKIELIAIMNAVKTFPDPAANFLHYKLLNVISAPLEIAS